MKPDKSLQRIIVIVAITCTAIAIGTVIAISAIDESRLSAIGSILSAAGTIIAAVLFTGGLYYQSQQIKEQREQFTINFSAIREDSRRNALALAKELLTESETLALRSYDKINTISDLPTAYMSSMSLYKILLESTDPTVLMPLFTEWNKLEDAAVTFLRGIKSSAAIYFKATDVDGVDYSKEPDEFVYIYGPLFWRLPFFDRYQGTAQLLAEIMIRLLPGREAVRLAGIVAFATNSPPRILRRDKMLKKIEEHKKLDYPIAAIVTDYYADGSEQIRGYNRQSIKAN